MRLGKGKRTIGFTLSLEGETAEDIPQQEQALFFRALHEARRKLETWQEQNPDQHRLSALYEKAERIGGGEISVTLGRILTKMIRRAFMEGHGPEIRQASAETLFGLTVETAEAMLKENERSVVRKPERDFLKLIECPRSDIPRRF